MDYEDRILSRVTVNYLFLGQYETFRASVKTLCRKNPAIAEAILQTVIKKVGDIEGVSWSRSITSPAHLAWLALSQILEIEESLLSERKRSLLWGLDSRLLSLQMEALFLLQQIIKALESDTSLLLSTGTTATVTRPLSSSSAEEPCTSVDASREDGSFLTSNDSRQEDVDSTLCQSDEKGLHTLKLIYDRWLVQLKTYLASASIPCDDEAVPSNLDVDAPPIQLVEESLFAEHRQFLQQAISREPELFSAVSWDVIKYQNLYQHMSIDFSGGDPGHRGDFESSTLRKAPPAFESLLHQEVQRAFLETLNKSSSSKEWLRLLPLLQNDFGIPDQIYRDVIHKVLKKTMNQDPGIFKKGKTDMAILQLYEAIQASGNAYLVSVIETAQDSFLHEDRESSKASSELALPSPLRHLHEFFQGLRLEESMILKDDRLNEDAVLSYCLRQLCHYSRATGTHMFDTVMDAALAAIKRQHFQKAADVLSIFPRLRPLAAAIGWDLLAGDTTARRLLMESLWTCKPVYSYPYIKHGDQVCCVDNLCDQLCYHIDLAYFAAHTNSGLEWAVSSFLYPYQVRGKSSKTVVELKPADAFVANLVLERLSMHSPIRVLFDVVPDIKFTQARALLKMCPVPSAIADSMRMQDLEILELHFGIQVVVLSLGAMERGMVNAEDKEYRFLGMRMLEELRSHILSMSNIPRRIFFMGIVVDLLLMDDSSTQSLPSGLDIKLKSILESKIDTGRTDDAVKVTTISFIGRLLEVLRECVFTSFSELEDQKMGIALPRGFTSLSGQKAWEWKHSNILRFIEDWNWRLAVLQRLGPSTHCQWQWKEALAVLRAAPSTLLNMCVQKAQYDLGEEAVHRFALPAEDEAALQLAEWVDGAVARASVDDAVSRVAEGASSPEEALQLAGLRSPLAPLANVLLCIDVAAASARAIDMSKQLLQKARSLLSDISSVSNQRQGAVQPEQIQETCILAVGKRVVQCLHDVAEKICTERNQTLQALLSGRDMVNVSSESFRQGHRYRALNILHQTIEDAYNGKRQFLSGKLHNLVKALADDENEENSLKPSTSLSDRKSNLLSENGILLGCGIRGPTKQSTGPTVGTVGGDHIGETPFYPLKGTGKRYLGPLVSKPLAYLSAFILYIATIGDIVDGVDTTHDFNFFMLVHERANDLLTRLVFERGSANAAGKIAEIMGADLAQEVISACVPPIYPPKSSRGWACVPLIPFRDSNPDNHQVRGSSAIKEHDSGLYPLNLDVVKHLATLSPVRAILACVFGTSKFQKTIRSFDGLVSASSGDGSFGTDTDRSFYEFALEQSDRFSTLNRWIQTQANLQQLSEFPMSSKRGNIDGQHFGASRVLTKRSREHESDTESEEEEEKLGISTSNHPTSDGHEKSQKGRMYDNAYMTREKSVAETFDSRHSTSLVFEWENESIYEDTVDRLLDEGKVVDALSLADRYLRGGAPDHLLQMLIEKSNSAPIHTGQWQSNHSTWSITWQYCIRLRDKRLAASLALKHFRTWELDAAIDVLTMCSCHLAEKDSMHDEVVQLKRSLQLYSRILRADGKFNSWQEVEHLCQRDPEELALRLAGKGAVSAALEVAEHYKLREDLCRELQGRHLVKLLTSEAANGGGPVAALRFLHSLNSPKEALPVAMAAIEQLPSLESKQLLVHFFLKRRVGMVSDAELMGLQKLALGLQMLGALPLSWQQRCAALHQHPQLILETLLMWKQLEVASELLRAFPSLRDDDLILRYAAKAITAGPYPKYERPSSASLYSMKPNRPNVSGHGLVGNNNLPSQREGWMTFAWSTKNSSNKITPKDMSRKRKSTSFSAAQKSPWDSGSGTQEERLQMSSQEGFERFTPFTMTEGCVLTGDLVKDDEMRESHRYETAPCVTLFKSLLGLCSSEEAAARACVHICVKQMNQNLNSERLPSNASSEVVERAFYATEAFVQVLLHAKGLLRKLLGNNETPGTGVGNSHTPNGPMQVHEIVINEAELPNELSELLIQVVEWLSRAELLQSLLGSGITASLNDVLSKSAAEKLRDKLIEGERYNMAVYCCTKCKIDAFPVWRAWAHAFVQMEHYAQARVKLKQALKLYEGDPVPIVRDIIATMEGSPPVDIASVRSLYNHMAKNANSIMDDSLSADAYLNVLYMPSSFTKSDRSRRPSEESLDSFASFSAQSGGEEGLKSNLDRSRYDECIFYLQEYARQDLLPFMFKHCHYADACLLFFPPKSIPPPISTVQKSDSSQKSDNLATDYGTIDDLCDLCVAYGAMPVLERIIATREIASTAQDPTISQHTAACLARVCAYCETHKHFNHLYRFQVLRKDYIAAGLCCIQLFHNSPNQEQALRHLERAKTNIDEGFYARQQGGDIAKASLKVTRGKSPSERFSEEELLKFGNRLAMQIEVVRCFSDAEGPPWTHSLFGNPNDADTIRRRLDVVEALTERNFDLAFRIIYDFALPAVQIYAAVAASLAERKKSNQLTELFKNIKATITDDDLDQVIGAAIMVFANKHKERPDRLIEMLSSSHRKVLSCVACGRLKTAFQFASRSGSIADVQYVSDQAKRMGVMSVVDMCKQWLSKQK